MNLRGILQRLHVVQPFDVDDVARAEVENVLRDHSSIMDRVDATIGSGLIEAQQKLRASIENSKTFSETARREMPAEHLMQLLGQSPGLNAFFPHGHPEI